MGVDYTDLRIGGALSLLHRRGCIWTVATAEHRRDKNTSPIGQALNPNTDTTSGSN